MKWTKEKPTEEGYYWMKEYQDDDDPEVVRIEKDGEFCRCGGGTYMSEVPEEGSLWIGPLKPPEEGEATYEEWKELKHKMAIEAIIMDFGDIMIPVAEARQRAEEALRSRNQDALNVEYRMGQALIILKKIEVPHE